MTRVLLVDDEPAVLEGLSLGLRSAPYQVDVALGADAALKRLERTPFAVIVADERMPGMSGSELLAEVRIRHPSTARIILSGHADVDAALRAINQAKVDAFLRKPCRPEALHAVIADALVARAVQTAGLKLMALVDEQARVSGTTVNGALRGELGRGAFTREMISTLSPRELEVLDLLASGQRLAQIARALFISNHTVRNHVKALFEKLDVHSQGELVERARR